ncbi:MAG TPA: hypothetical protein VM680_02605 [Verrucomicrobiae bacterium]|nr:hypothetical protein [Verrucomicrobiae bacterium]
MNAVSKSFKAQPTPLVSLFIAVTTVLAAVFLYQYFFSAGVIDFGPIMIWLAIAVPTGIFASVFLHVRATKRAQQLAQQVHASVGQLQGESRFGTDPRRAATASELNRPLPEKDPFENL